MKRFTILAVAAASLALAAPALARNVILWVPGTTVDFKTVVNGVREIPAGMPMPGIHLDVTVEGHAVDVYVAPKDFATKFDVKVAKGDTVIVAGKLMAPTAGTNDVLLANEISTGEFHGGIFKVTLTVFLRNADGPFWVEPAVPLAIPLNATD